MENWVAKRARLSPGRVALRCGGQEWTFAQLADEVADRARRLAARGDLGRIGFCCESSPSLYFWLLAAASTGAELVLLNTRLTAAELGEQLAVAGCGLVVCDDARREVLRASGTPAVLASAAELARWPQAEAWEPVDVDLDAVATIMFTSGTTGRAKGVMQSWGNHFSSAVGSVLNLGLEPDRDAWVCAVPLFHISGFSIVVRGLVYGIPVVLLPRFDAAEVNRLLLAGEATTVSVVTAMLRAMLDDLGERQYPDTLRALLLGGGFVDDDTLRRCLERGLPVVFSYGMTETASQVVAMPLAEVAAKPGSAGLPHLGVDVRIDAAPGQAGEIQLRSPTVCVGYLEQPDAYAAAFTADGWFRTGDLGRIDADGYLYVDARLAEMIISGGENVRPAEVENALLAHPDVAEAAVVGRDDERWGQVPVAHVVPRPGTSPDPATLIAWCRDRIAAYKVPADVVMRESLPRSATGKLRRRDLVDRPA